MAKKNSALGAIGRDKLLQAVTNWNEMSRSDAGLAIKLCLEDDAAMSDPASPRLRWTGRRAGNGLEFEFFCCCREKDEKDQSHVDAQGADG